MPTISAELTLHTRSGLDEIIASDSFDRTNSSTLGNTDSYAGGTAKPWTKSNSAFSIYTNYLQYNIIGGTFGTATIPLSDDMSYKADFEFQFIGTNSFLGAYLRYNLLSGNLIDCRYDEAAGAIYIIEYVSGSIVSFSSAAISLSASTWYDASVSIRENDVTFTVNGTSTTYTIQTPASFDDPNYNIFGLYSARQANFNDLVITNLKYTDNIPLFVNNNERADNIPLIIRNVYDNAIVSDSFNRANSTDIGDPDLFAGGDVYEWQSQITYSIIDNKLHNTIGSAGVNYINPETKNFQLDYDFYTPEDGLIGCFVRQQPGGFDWIYCLVDTANDSIDIYEYLDNIPILKVSEAVTVSPSSIYHANIVCYEDTISFDVDGTTVEHTAISTQAINTDTNSVMGFYSDKSDMWFDNFIVRDIDAQNNIPLYISGPVYSSGNLPLYTIGHDVSSSGIPLFIHGHQLINNNIPLYTVGANFHNEDLTLFTKSVPNPSSANSMPLWTYSTNNSGLYNTIPLNIGLGWNPDWTITLFAKTQESETTNQSMTLYVNNNNGSNEVLPLFVQNGYLASNSGIPMHIQGLGSLDGGLTYNDNITLFMARDTEKVAQGLSSFIKVAEASNNAVSIYMSGSPTQSTNSIPLIIKDILEDNNNNIDFYIHGF